MNDANLEHLLRSLKPAAPSADLAERVKHDLALADLFRESAESSSRLPAQQSKRVMWATSAFWAGIGAAAAVVVMMVLPQGIAPAPGASQLATSSPSAAMSSSSIMPVSSTREWVGVEDQGISYSMPDNPQRQMRVRSVERHQWIDPRDGAEYTVEVPQVESVALPVKFQ